MSEDLHRYLPQILAVLIERAGGTLEFSDKEHRRIATMENPDLEFCRTGAFTGPAMKIRYTETVNIKGEVVADPVQSSDSILSTLESAGVAKQNQFDALVSVQKVVWPGCHSARDGDCYWDACPQLADGEPKATGRHCPRDTRGG